MVSDIAIAQEKHKKLKTESIAHQDRYSKRLVYTSDANAADQSEEEEFGEDIFEDIMLRGSENKSMDLEDESKTKDFRSASKKQSTPKLQIGASEKKL